LAAPIPAAGRLGAVEPPYGRDGFLVGTEQAAGLVGELVS